MMPPDDHARKPRRSSLLAALVDVKFEREVTPILVRWVYVCALAVIGIGILFGLLWVWSLATWLGWAMWLAAPLVIGLGLIMLLVVRIACERVLASFRRPWPVAPPQDSAEAFNVSPPRAPR